MHQKGLKIIFVIIFIILLFAPLREKNNQKRVGGVVMSENIPPLGDKCSILKSILVVCAKFHLGAVRDKCPILNKKNIIYSFR